GNGERDPLVERTREQRHLSGVGASRYRQVAHIDGQRALPRSDLDAINEAAHAPRPCAVLSDIPRPVPYMVFRVQIEVRIAGMVAGEILRDLVVVVRYPGDVATGEDVARETPGAAGAEERHADHCRERTVPRWKVDARPERQRSPIR